MNFLSICRTYLDHTETSLKRKFGAESEQFKNFKTACSYEYDNCFAYRFLYKLRNYSQHCGVPVGSISIDSRAEDNGQVDYSISVQFDRDSLLRNYDSWGIPVKKELENLTDLFPVNEYIDEVMASFERINLALIEERIPELVEGAEYIYEMIRPFEEQPGIPCIIDFKNMQSNGGKLKIEWFPLHLLQMVAALGD
ncbi:hypothetical protein [Metabacillus fastidiosus]|uniref:hypothetical protein n=1 Tax=Metabacillus fastidiosus TaxID=1458 RepID=UPI003D2A8EF0